MDLNELCYASAKKRVKIPKQNYARSMRMSQPVLRRDLQLNINVCVCISVYI